MKIITAKPGYTIEQVLDLTNQLASMWWQLQGYTVENGELIGKNAKTGEDMPDAARTTTWDEIKEHIDGTRYFTSLSNSPQFVDWEEYWQAYELPACYNEIEMPEEWSD